jgi:hypothetical protein
MEHRVPYSLILASNTTWEMWACLKFTFWIVATKFHPPATWSVNWQLIGLFFSTNSMGDMGIMFYVFDGSFMLSLEFVLLFLK